MSNTTGNRIAVSSLLNGPDTVPYHHPPQNAHHHLHPEFQRPLYRSHYVQGPPEYPVSLNLAPVKDWTGPPPRLKLEDDTSHVPAPSSSRQPLDILVDVASRAPIEPQQHRSREVHGRTPTSYIDELPPSSRSSNRLAARGANRLPNYAEHDEDDELLDDFEPAPAKGSKRRWQGDTPDSMLPPNKKRSPSGSTPAPGTTTNGDNMIIDSEVQPSSGLAGHSSPRSRARAAPAAAAKSARSAEIAKQNGAARTKRPRKVRQAEDWKYNPKVPQSGYVFKKEFQNPDGSVEEALGELQYSRCMSNRYKNDDFPRCLSCTRRWAGDTCRFQGVRLFYRNASGHLRGIDFVDAPVTPGSEMAYPGAWNRELKPEHVRRVKEVAARALLRTLREEEGHLQRPDLVRRQRETDCRATCDTCLTAVFAGSWICTNCGREACANCYDKIAEMCSDPQQKKKVLDASPFFLTCTKKQEHVLANYRPISRFGKTELTDVIYEMERVVPSLGGVLTEADSSPSTSSVAGATASTSTSASAANSAHPSPRGAPAQTANGQVPSVSSSASSPGPGTEMKWCPPLPEVARGDLSYKPVRLFHRTEVDESAFAPLWASGLPFVVEGLDEVCKIKWTPEYFIKNHGGDQCLVVECQNDNNRRLSVEDFFAKFGQYEGRDECLKLKDWPSNATFKQTFPILYEDFMRIVPMPDYTRRDGILNISSHFPHNTVGPDLGPKMYNAFASNLDQGSKGTTRLHMDMADAVNIMHYSALARDGGEGGAVWDIFAAEDTLKIRNFLRGLGKGKHQTSVDPIHGQSHYLDNALMQELYDQEGVTSFRIFQQPGQAVFIPAGCAHQVCNLSDCIKVAVDFVSPQNIERCERLTNEFREQNQATLWKEDILQLRTMLWFAWLSCSRYDRTGAPPPPRAPLELPANVPMPSPMTMSNMFVAVQPGPPPRPSV